MSKYAFIWVTILGLASFQGLAVNSDNVGASIKIEQGAIKDAQKSQKQIDALFSKTESLFEQYKQVNKQIDGLKVYNGQIQRQISQQEHQLKQVIDAIDKASLIERQISPLILRMLTTLKHFVELDMPFHSEERDKRLTQLKRNQDRPELTLAERFRQVLEAYKIELEYGRTMDSYRQVIEINNNEREVNILRVGRIALLFQTPDKKVSGYWNKLEKNWVQLDSNLLNAEISQGIRMAKKQVSLDIVTVPIPLVENFR